MILVKKRKKDLSSSDDTSSDSDGNNCFLNYGMQSKTVHVGASCSKTNDSDSSASDDLPSKVDQNIKLNEKSGNKGMSLMVFT